ncbi:MAG: tRNA dihydrouridine synthase DusB [Oscillospiraceae bacterium]|nr:tRNA dihydrouridine synthase DusB [Oscillospiraceae bacterium]
MKTVTIAGLSLEQSAALAPMASVADKAYRLICKEYGAVYVVGEMVSAKALCYGDRKSRALLEVAGQEPMAVQLFGSEPELMARAARIAAEYQPQVIDINMGCPVPKVAGNGCGSALMRAPERAARLVRAAAEAVELPVTVKIRKGWDDSAVNAPMFARAMEAAGAAAVAVHGRTRQQMYRPPVDREIIRQVKEAVSIPVIGNGGIVDGPSALEMYQETGCDLVMVAQGSYGRPWVFRQIRRYLEAGELLPEPPLAERLEVMLRHVSMMVEFKGERLGMTEARKIAAWYIKGSPGAAAFRGACGRLSSWEDLKSLTAQVLRQSLETED